MGYIPSLTLFRLGGFSRSLNALTFQHMQLSKQFFFLEMSAAREEEALREVAEVERLRKVVRKLGEER